MASWKQALAKTRGRIAESLAGMFGRGGQPDESAIEDLEETLLQADVPVRLVAGCIETLALPCPCLALGACGALGCEAEITLIDHHVA